MNRPRRRRDRRAGARSACTRHRPRHQAHRRRRQRPLRHDRLTAHRDRARPFPSTDELEQIARLVRGRGSRGGRRRAAAEHGRHARARPPSAAIHDARRLATVVDVPVEMHDERRTTVSADRSMIEAGLDALQRRQRVDKGGGDHAPVLARHTPASPSAWPDAGLGVITGEPGFDRRPSNWAADEWDEVGEVPVVERLPHQSRLRQMVGVGGDDPRRRVDPRRRLGRMVVRRAGQAGRRARRAGAVHGVRGDTVDSLASRLEREGFVEDASVFTRYVDRNGGLASCRATTSCAPTTTSATCSPALRHAARPRPTSQITFPEGLHDRPDGRPLGRAAAAGPSATAFAAAAGDPSVISAYRPAGVTSTGRALVPRHLPGVERRQ